MTRCEMLLRKFCVPGEYEKMINDVLELKTHLGKLESKILETKEFRDINFNNLNY